MRLLAALGHEGAREMLASPVPLLFIDRQDDRPTWEAFSWWFDGLGQLDSTALLAAGVIVGDLLLSVCDPTDHVGDLKRIVDELRRAWDRAAPNDCLRPMTGRIQEINEAECALDSGGEMPAPRLAARAITHLALEFTGSDSPSDWMANAVEGLEHSTGLDRFAVEERLKAGITRLVLGRASPQ